MDTTTNQETNQKKKKKYFPIIFGVLITLGIVFFIFKYFHSQHHIETDDAQIESNISPVIPKVSGYAVELRVDDNQLVKKGDTLIILDDADYELKVKEAEAALESARANLEVVRANIGASKANEITSAAGVNAAKANIEAAKIRLWKAEQDYQRYANLWEDRSIPQQQFDQAKAEKESAEKQLEALTSQKEVAYGQSKEANMRTNVTFQNIAVAEALVKMKEAELELAKNQLEYTVVTAPVNGIISKRNVQVGQLVQAGQQIFAIVMNQDIWVVANFKETQMTKMRQGQDVRLEVDAFPGADFKGKVESISPATGAQFSLLPPDNSTGNFVKVVQRIPVKITFTNDPKDLSLLCAGMNVVVDVHVN